MTVYLRDRRPVRHRPGSGRDLAALVSRRPRPDLARERRNVLRQTSPEFSRLARISKAQVVRFEIIRRTATIVML
ncbi:hypothetical protein [Rhizobium leguminosarum]|uniref:hypothetical protein n=1 Tax=Rhizobium leguminosarum TaxID=384 RepID=UPI001C965015|nr:hypothetical protein [Rhizobium leguminosarum]MBY5524497.1 hypothetical protein [Rhizobium leguminosarum]